MRFSARVTARASGGGSVPNFGLETSPETVVLKPVTAAAASAANSQLVGPSGGQTSSLTAGSFTLGACVPAAAGTVCDTALAWTEVGDLALSAAIANPAGYLASGLTPWGSAAAGPFAPAYLITELDPAQPCGSFTYSGQPFRIKVSAMSAANGVLGSSAAVMQNYTGAYARAVTLGTDGGTCVPATSGYANNTLAATDFAATPGVASTAPVTNTVAPLPISYSQALAAPATITVCARDADGIDSHGQTQASLAIRNGRLRLGSAAAQRLEEIVRDGLSVYRVDGDALRAHDPDVIVTQDHCEVCAVSLSDVEAATCTWTGQAVDIVSLKPDSMADVYADIFRVARALGSLARRG